MSVGWLDDTMVVGWCSIRHIRVILLDLKVPWCREFILSFFFKFFFNYFHLKNVCSFYIYRVMNFFFMYICMYIYVSYFFLLQVHTCTVCNKYHLIVRVQQQKNQPSPYRSDWREKNYMEIQKNCTICVIWGKIVTF